MPRWLQSGAGSRRFEAGPEIVLQAADVVVLRGTAEGVARAQDILLK